MERAERIEWSLDVVAAGLFGVAAACLSYRIAGGASAASSGALASILGLQVLRSIAPEQTVYRLPALVPGPVEAADDELILSDADRLEPQLVQVPEEVLELTDILNRMPTDSRVVRLFGPDAMPTPGQLKARIDRHIAQGPPSSAFPDASRELQEALAELRRTLR